MGLMQGQACVECRIPVVCRRESSSAAIAGVVSSIRADGLVVEVEQKLSRGEHLLMEAIGPNPGAVPCVVRDSRRQTHRSPRHNTGNPPAAPREPGYRVTLQWATSVEALGKTWATLPLQLLDYLAALGHGASLPQESVPELLADALQKLRSRPFLRHPGPQPDGLSLVERRSIGRLLCRYDVWAVGEDARLPAVVVDLSPAGLALEALQPLRRGATVLVEPPADLEFQQTAPVRARVVYCKKMGDRLRIGLSLEDPDLVQTWLAVGLRFLGFSRLHVEEKRRYVRAKASRPLPVELCAWGSEPVAGAVLDLGRGGALLESPRAFSLDEQVRLVIGPLGKLPLLYLSGMVLHLQATAAPGKWLLRLRFIELDATQRELDKYVLSLLRAAATAP